MAKKKTKKRTGSATCQKVSSYKRKGKKVKSETQNHCCRELKKFLDDPDNYR